MKNEKEELLKRIDEIKKEAERNGRFSLFHAKCLGSRFNQNNTYDGMKYLFDIIEGWDKYCNLPYNLGISLEGFVNDPSIVVGVHRTNLNIKKDENGFPVSTGLDKIMSEGLINYGHANAYGGGAFTSIPAISLTMTPLKGLEGYINLVGRYHNNDAIILAAFPRELVDDDCDIIDYSRANEIYNISTFWATVKPEYLMGAIVKNDNGYDEFYTRDEIVEYSKERQNTDKTVKQM